MTPIDITLCTAGIAIVLVMFMVAARFLESSRDLKTRREIGELRLKVDEMAQFMNGTLKRWAAEKKALEKKREQMQEKEKALEGADESNGEQASAGQMWSKDYWRDRARKQGLLQ